MMRDRPFIEVLGEIPRDAAVVVVRLRGWDDELVEELGPALRTTLDATGLVNTRALVLDDNDADLTLECLTDSELATLGLARTDA
jgi:hypothetical protein